MAGTRISRFSDASPATIVFTDGANTTAGFGYNCYSAGMILVESVVGTPTLTFYVRHDPTSAKYHQVINTSGTAVTLAVAADKAYPIPAELAGATYVMPVASIGTSATVRILVKG
jgi:hypothetical protein